MDAQPVTFGRGEAVVVPAAVDWFRVIPQWDVEFLTMKLPSTEHREDLLRMEVSLESK
jgi:hypothetical protein